MRAAKGNIQLSVSKSVQRRSGARYSMRTGRDAEDARQFMDLLTADRILFDAIQTLSAKGFSDHTETLQSERGRIVEKLAKLQSAAYREFGYQSA